MNLPVMSSPTTMMSAPQNFAEAVLRVDGGTSIGLP
jgi:hypothetical protein